MLPAPPKLSDFAPLPAGPLSFSTTSKPKAAAPAAAPPAGGALWGPGGPFAAQPAAAAAPAPFVPTVLFPPRAAAPAAAPPVAPASNILIIPKAVIEDAPKRSVRERMADNGPSAVFAWVAETPVALDFAKTLKDSNNVFQLYEWFTRDENSWAMFVDLLTDTIDCSAFDEYLDSPFPFPAWQDDADDWMA
jgi:hypothetical protein